jgi:hypothetical protein
MSVPKGDVWEVVRRRVLAVRSTCFDDGLATCACTSCVSMRDLMEYLGLPVTSESAAEVSEDTQCG